jgi:predicted TIM-barrel fold metal-dependent hydrolase
MSSRTSKQIRSELDHPIIDTDGHVLELLDATYPYLRETLGAKNFQRWLDRGAIAKVAQREQTVDRSKTRVPQGSWWGGPPASNVKDRATAILPALLADRMDELGMDFAVLYPTNTLLTCAETDEDIRRGLCAGFNTYYAEMYSPFRDRMAMAGIIPMHTPEEAVAELQHCKDLGLKTVCFPEGVVRPIAEPSEGPGSPWFFPGQTHWFDSFGLDSQHDYDPVWSACTELGFVAAFHGGLTVRPGLHCSTSSYVANHVGQFAASMYPLCKALLFGGVPARFPDLPMTFLECGVSWAMQMLNDVIEHWEKRNIDVIGTMDPELLDRTALAEYMSKYGGALNDLLASDPFDYIQRLPIHGGTPDELDEFIHMRVTSRADIAAQFTRSFFFGCEADDRGIATAFSPLVPEGRMLNVLFSSDIGHWDVPDMADVVRESHELVDDGILTPEQWRAAVCDNAIDMYERVNPEFFVGTTVEAYAKSRVPVPRPR